MPFAYVPEQGVLPPVGFLLDLAQIPRMDESQDCHQRDRENDKKLQQHELKVCPIYRPPARVLVVEWRWLPTSILQALSFKKPLDPKSPIIPQTSPTPDLHAPKQPQMPQTRPKSPQMPQTTPKPAPHGPNQTQIPKTNPKSPKSAPYPLN